MPAAAPPKRKVEPVRKATQMLPASGVALRFLSIKKEERRVEGGHGQADLVHQSREKAACHKEGQRIIKSRPRADATAGNRPLGSIYGIDLSIIVIIDGISCACNQENREEN